MSPARSTTRAQRAGTIIVASTLAVGGSALALGATVGSASSHREAPMTAADPTVDNTDTYAFLSPDDGGETTTLIASWLPFQEPGGGPNFYPWAEGDEALYNIKIDNDGDAVPDITYEWNFSDVDVREAVQYNDGTPQPADGSFIYNNGPVTSFDDATLLFKQTYDLNVITNDDPTTRTMLLDNQPVAPSHVGDASMPNYQDLRDEAVVPLSLPDGLVGSSFAGQAEDSFFLDLRVFDLLYGGDLSEVGYDTLAPYNVNSVALQIPTELLVDRTVLYDVDNDGVAAEPDPTIGVWSTTDRASERTLNGDGTLTLSGEFVQVSRLGNPLVNEVVIPAYLKNAFNALDPVNDESVTLAVNKVLNPELPYLIEAVYPGAVPIKATPRTDLQAIFLTGVTGLNRPLVSGAKPSEVLRLNTSIAVTAAPSRLGVLGGDFQGFPNGRRLTDDVLDIALQAVAGAVTVNAEGGVTDPTTDITIVPALAAGDEVDANNVAFFDTFPYLALPNSGSQEQAVNEVPVPGPTVTVTTAAAPAPTVTTTVAAGTRATGPAPRGGIETGQAGTSGPSTGGLALMGLAVLALGAGGYVAVSRRGRQAGSA